MSAGSVIKQDVNTVVTYNAVLPTLLNGQTAGLQSDSSARLLVREDTLSRNAGATDANTLRVALSAEDKALLDGLEGFVDGIEALIVLTNGYVDGIEALIGTTNTSLSTIQGYVDGLEGFTDGLEGLITTLNGYVDGLESQLPSALGQQAIAGSLSVVLATGFSIPLDLDFGAGATDTKTIRVRLSDEDRALLDGLEGFTDGIEGLLTTMNGYVDGLEGLATSLNGYVDGLEGFTDGLEASLSSLDTKSVQLALNYGAATGALRVASQIGNASGIADFGSGATSAQTLRVVPASDVVQTTVKQQESVQSSAQTYSTGWSAGFFDAAADDIPGNASASQEVIASLAANVKKWKITDTTGFHISFRVGAANGTQQFIIPPGFDGIIEHYVASGSRVSIRAIGAAAIVSGELVIEPIY